MLSWPLNGCTTPSKQGGNNSKGFEDFYLKDKAKIWPCLSYMCHILLTAATPEIAKGTLNWTCLHMQTKREMGRYRYYHHYHLLLWSNQLYGTTKSPKRLQMSFKGRKLMTVRKWLSEQQTYFKNHPRAAFWGHTGDTTVPGKNPKPEISNPEQLRGGLEELKLLKELQEGWKPQIKGFKTTFVNQFKTRFSDRIVKVSKRCCPTSMAFPFAIESCHTRLPASTESTCFIISISYLEFIIFYFQGFRIYGWGV